MNTTLGKYIIIIAADSVVAHTDPSYGSVYILEKAKDAAAAAEYITSLVQNKDSPCEVVSGMVIAMVSTTTLVPARSLSSEALPSYLTQSVQDTSCETLASAPRCHVEVLDPSNFLPTALSESSITSVDRGSWQVQCIYRTWDKTTVHMNPHLTKEDVQEYVQHPSAWQGKAGGFGIQDLAATFITGIKGDYYNVMGLPIQRVGAVMAHIIEKLSNIPPTQSK